MSSIHLCAPGVLGKGSLMFTHVHSSKHKSLYWMMPKQPARFRQGTSNWMEFEKPPSLSICFLGLDRDRSQQNMAVSKSHQNSPAGIADLANAFFRRRFQDVDDAHELAKEMITHHASASVTRLKLCLRNLGKTDAGDRELDPRCRLHIHRDGHLESINRCLLARAFPYVATSILWWPIAYLSSESYHLSLLPALFNMPQRFLRANPTRHRTLASL